MKLIDALKVAIETKDIPMLARVVDQMRYVGMRYEDIYQRAHKQTEIGRAEWDALLEQVDEADAEDAGVTARRKADQ